LSETYDVRARRPLYSQGPVVIYIDSVLTLSCVGYAFWLRWLSYPAGGAFIINWMAVLCKMPQYSIRFEAIRYLRTSCLLPAFDDA